MTSRSVLNPPEDQPAQAVPDIVRVASEALAAAAACLMVELEAKGEDKGQDKLDKRLAIVKQLKVGGFILKIDGNRVVFACRFGCFWRR